MDSTFAVVSENFMSNPMLQRFSPIFCFRNFIILQLHLHMGLIHLELASVYNMY